MQVDSENINKRQRKDIALRRGIFHKKVPKFQYANIFPQQECEE